MVYEPIRKHIDQLHDNTWKDRLITFQETLLLPQGAISATIQRNWYLQPITGASETIDHTLYFVTINFTDASGKPQTLKAVEKNIEIHNSERRVNYGLALNKPSDMEKKHAFLQENGIPTYDWIIINQKDTAIYVPDLTEKGCEVLDARIYLPEEFPGRRLEGVKLPDWARQYSKTIDLKMSEIIKVGEEAGMEFERDCLYIIKPKIPTKEPRVIVGDLGQGLFHPDDPNIGKKDLRIGL